MGPHQVGLDLKEIGSLECGWYQGAHHHVGGWPFSIAAQSWWEHHMQHDHQSCSANHAMVLLALPPLPQPVTPDSLSTSSNFPFFNQSNFLQHQHTWRTSQELVLTSAEWDWANPNLADMLNIVVLDLVNQQRPKLTVKLLLRKSPLCSFWRLEKRRWEGVSHRPPVRSRPPMKEVSFRMLLGPSVSTITTFWWCEYSVPTTWSQHITLVIMALPQILPKPSPGSDRVY